MTGLTRRYATLRITHTTVVGELSAVVVDLHPEQRSTSGRRWRRLASPLTMALAMVTVSLVGTPRGRALLTSGAARVLRATTRPRLPPARGRHSGALPPGPV